MTDHTNASVSTAGTIGLVARREFMARVATKAFLVGNAVILLLIAAGLIFASIVSNNSDDHTKIGVVGDAHSLTTPLMANAAALKMSVRVVAVTDEQAARDKVDAGDLDVAIVAEHDDSYVALVDTRLSTETRTLIDTTVRQSAVDVVLGKQGVDPAELTAAAGQVTLSVDAANPPNPHSDQRTALAYVALIVMFAQILMFGIYVAMGVVEEKTSRVVEVLLATIKPLHLLWGKVIGIGTVGLVQLLAYGVVGLGVGVGTGLVTIPGTAVAVFASVLGWFILGFAFFAVLYAAAGSLVSRQEDVNSVTTPITMLILAMYGLAQFAVADPGNSLVTVMSWIPPFSAMLMPLRIASDTTGPVQVVGTIALMALATLALAKVAARVYERSVLRSGQRVRWREAMGRGTARNT